MAIVFCTTCNHTGETRYVINGGLIVLGVLGALIGFIFLALGIYQCFFMLVLLGAVCALVGYNSRTYFCAGCGSGTFIPADSPRAIEFRNRDSAFERIEDRLEQQPDQPARTIPGPRRRFSGPL